ncbi:MAG: xanthine dehydrogenase accessory protein XdhC [Rhizomicrobium sp.]
MTGWWIIAGEHATRGEASVLVTVCSVAGSAPREAGTKMLVWRDGQHGTIGGGNLEYVVLDQARKMLAGEAAHRFQSYPLGPLLGQCCGGRVGMLLERIDAGTTSWLAQIGAAEDSGEAYAVHSVLEPGRVAKRVLGRNDVRALPADAVVLTARDGARVDPAAAKIATDGLSIVERIDPRPLLLMFGAGHVGRGLAPIAASLPLRTRWYDTRLEFGAVEGALQPVIADDLVAQATAAPAGALYLVFTQSHALDYDLTRAVLARGDFLYCGLIGSATKRARFEKRLLADGIAHAMLPRLICPIGNIGLASKDPAVLAVAVAAELMFTIEARAVARSLKAVHVR